MNYLTALLALAAFVAPISAASVKPAVPQLVTVKKVTYNGNGCPANTAQVAISPDNLSFTVIMQDYIAEIGPGIAKKENRKTCQLNIEMEYPPGYSYSILHASFRGFYNIDAGVTAYQEAMYYFSGKLKQARLDTHWVGPANDPAYLLPDSVPADALVFSPCKEVANLNIASVVRLEKSSAKKFAESGGIIGTDSIDGASETQDYKGFKFDLKWKQC